MKRLLLVVATSVVMAVGLASPAAAQMGPNDEACFLALFRAGGGNIGQATSAAAHALPPGGVGSEVSGRAQARTIGCEAPGRP